MNDSGLYILDGKTPIKEPDLQKWGEWMQTAKRIVRRDAIAEVLVSTVFLGLDHDFIGGAPLLFETMVFGGSLDGEMDRCGTYEGAEIMHEAMCERVKLTAAMQAEKLP